MKLIKNKTYEGDNQQAGVSSTRYEGVSFGGRKKGSYALKKTKKVELSHCAIDTVNTLWESNDIKLDHVTFSIEARSGLWHCRGVNVNDCRFLAPKAIRETTKAVIQDTFFQGEELAWKCGGVDFIHCIVQSQYFLFCSHGIKLQKSNCTGAYALQYVEKGEIRESVILSEDALLHSKNITIYDSDLNGDRLGWYSENLRLVNCRIFGKNPLAFCHNLIIENCQMEGCEDAFEYSELSKCVIDGSIKSIKNPDKGTIEAGSIGEIINDRSKERIVGAVSYIDHSKAK